MKKSLRIVCLCFLIATFAGCASTGGTGGAAPTISGSFSFGVQKQF